MGVQIGDGLGIANLVLVRLLPQIVVVRERMVAQPAQTGPVAQHDNDHANDEQGQGGHGGIKKVKSHLLSLDVALALLQLYVLLTLALVVQGAALGARRTLLLWRLMHWLQVVNANYDVLGKHLLVMGGLEKTQVSTFLYGLSSSYDSHGSAGSRRRPSVQ